MIRFEVNMNGEPLVVVLGEGGSMFCIPTCFLATKSSVINDPSFVCIVGSIKGNHLGLLHYI